MKKIIVISLGGSLILNKNCDVNVSYLKKLKSVLQENSKKFKFIIVCGGGSVARKYIQGISQITKDHKLQSLAGISATRMNARFMSYFFNQDAEKGIPHKISEIKKYLEKKDVVFCGALEYKDKQTSDSTSADIAKHFKAEFINLTNVDGLYNKDPSKFKDAKFTSEITWKEFNKIANSIKFTPGQHFVLDQTAAKTILKNKTKTYIIGNDTKQLDNLLKSKPFKGTTINR